MDTFLEMTAGRISTGALHRQKVLPPSTSKVLCVPPEGGGLLEGGLASDISFNYAVILMVLTVECVIRYWDAQILRRGIRDNDDASLLL
jgi:hypothetical protein